MTRTETRQRLEEALDDLLATLAATGDEVAAFRDELHATGHDGGDDTPPGPDPAPDPA